MGVVDKEIKLFYYIKGFVRPWLPNKSLDKRLNNLYRQLDKKNLLDVEERVNYYNKLTTQISVSHKGTRIKDLIHPKTPKAHYFDTYRYARYFDKEQLIDYTFGDVNVILDFPMICKSRPIYGENQNNIILKLNALRHFVRVRDPYVFASKKNMLFGRGVVHQQRRADFFDQYFDNPLCDLGQTGGHKGKDIWKKEPVSIEEHLKYKFILSIEGYDVATNLKWIMSSNSIAVSPPLTMETWYMEGKLVPNQHFITIKEDFSDLEEKLMYYVSHEKECLEIINEAQQYRAQFNNPIKEELISILVLKKYFSLVK